MPWPKGRSRSVADKLAISSGLIEGKPIRTCEHCGAKFKTSPAYIKAGKARWCSHVCRDTDPAHLAVLKERAKDPIWLKRVSEGTKKRMHDPEIRERHLAGLERVRNESPTNSSWKGGQGQEINTLEKSYDWLLSAGYISNFPVHITKAVQDIPPIWYRLDYALPLEKICFEIDGPTHKYKQEEDAKKDSTLALFGWKIIRIRHWN